MAVNEALIRRTLAAIKADLDQWDQADWVGHNDCGTTYCFGGWAYLLATGRSFSPQQMADDNYDAFGEVQALLGLDLDEALKLFYFMPEAAEPEEAYQELVERIEVITGLELKEAA